MSDPSPAPVVDEPASVLGKRERSETDEHVSNGEAKEEVEKTGQKPPKKPKVPPPQALPFKEGSSKVMLEHMYDKTLPKIEVEIANNDLQYDAAPCYLGTPEKNFVYLNPQHSGYFSQSIPAPALRMWVINKGRLVIQKAYAKRRLFEDAMKLNIQLKFINPRKIMYSYPPLDVDPKFVVYAGKLYEKPDGVLTRCGANIDYWGLTCVRYFEQIGVRVFNNIHSLEVTRDKLYTYQVLSAHGIAAPRTYLSTNRDNIEEVEKRFSYPVILKNTSGSLGEAVWKADNREELEKLITTIPKDKPLIFQEFIKTSTGRDIRIYVVGDKVVSAMMRINTEDFKANIAQGGFAVPVQCDEELSKLAVDITKICGLDMAGIDVLLGDGKYVICEVNASALFEGIERYTGVNIAYNILEYSLRTFQAEQAEKKQKFLQASSSSA